MTWAINHKRGKFEVAPSDDPLDRTVVCDSRVDAEIICGVLNAIDPLKLNEIRKEAVMRADEWLQSVGKGDER